MDKLFHAHGLGSPCVRNHQNEFISHLFLGRLSIFSDFMLNVSKSFVVFRGGHWRPPFSYVLVEHTTHDELLIHACIIYHTVHLIRELDADRLASIDIHAI